MNIQALNARFFITGNRNIKNNSQDPQMNFSNNFKHRTKVRVARSHRRNKTGIYSVLHTDRLVYTHLSQLELKLKQTEKI